MWRMDRTLILIPKMFSEKELKKRGVVVPNDLEDKSGEFWSYVEERLRVLSTRIKRVYVESACGGEVDELANIKGTDEKLHRIIGWLVDQGAEIMATEDKLLILETESWSSLAHEHPGGAEDEMLEESLRDRCTFVSKRISETLKEGETGVLFVDILRELSFDSGIRVIRMMPFDPRDYLKAWLISSRLQWKRETEQAE